MTYCLLAVQLGLLVLLVRRGCRPLLFTIAVVSVFAENIVYEVGNVAVGMHTACGVARLLAAAEAIWLLTRGTDRRTLAAAGIGITAIGGGMALLQAEMQFNLRTPWMWRGLGIGWACAAVGLMIALVSAYRWRLGLPWMRRHGLIALAYFTEQTITYFLTPLNRGQWNVWYNLHSWFLLVVWGTWAVLFFRYRPRKIHNTYQHEGYGYR